jgi:hypothetical protein
LENASNRFPQDTVLAERICRLNKHAQQARGAATYAPMIDPPVKQLVGSFKRSLFHNRDYHDYFIVTTSKRISGTILYNNSDASQLHKLFFSRTPDLQMAESVTTPTAPCTGYITYGYHPFLPLSVGNSSNNNNSNRMVLWTICLTTLSRNRLGNTRHFPR